MRSLRGIGFFAVHLVLATVALGAVWRRSHELDAQRLPPPLQNEPFRVAPLYDDPRVVTDDQLLDVLYRLRPRLRGPQPKVNHVDHALRFWGLEAKFRDPECLSGEEMRDLLLDHRRFAAAWGRDAQPLLVPLRNGVRVRTQEGLATASHVDHTLGCLAEVGVPLEHPILTANGPSRVQAMLEQSLRDFSLNQLEYEWSTLAYTLYLAPTQSWITSEGQRVSFDTLAERLMRQRLNEGVCMGNHRLHTLTMLLRVDEQSPRLSPEQRQRVVEHLQDATRRLIASQHTEGYWLGNWPEPPGAASASDAVEDTIARRVLGTGHALEWWALAPEEVHPPRETIIRAGQWLVRTIQGMDDAQIKDNYTFLSHAGRALALWRGRFPAELALQLPAPSSSANPSDGKS